MPDEIASPAAQAGTASPAAEASPAPDQVTSGAPPQESTSADTPDGARPNRAQERIEELVAQNKALREYGEFFRQRFEEHQRQPAQAAAPAPTQEQPEPEPNADDFDDPKAYARACTEWARKQNAKEVARAIEQARTEGKTAAEKAFTEAQEKQRRGTLESQFVARSQEYAAKNPDFMTVAVNPAMTFLHGDFLEAVQASEKGPELIHHIGKDPKLVAKLVSLPVPQRLAMLGRIEADLSRPPPPPKVTTAPPPPAPIGSGSSGGEPDPSKMSIDDWMAWRTKQKREQRQAR